MQQTSTCTQKSRNPVIRQTTKSSAAESIELRKRQAVTDRSDRQWLAQWAKNMKSVDKRLSDGKIDEATAKRQHNFIILVLLRMKQMLLEEQRSAIWDDFLAKGKLPAYVLASLS